MNVLIVGLGRTGSHLTAALAESGNHRIVAVESDEVTAGATPESGNVRVVWNDGCEPSVLEEAGVRNADLVVASTGDDEDNLVIAQLAKFHFQVPRVIARVNNPRNEWLFTREWGVDVAVSQTEIIARIIEEQMSLGDLVTLLKLKHGEMALTEITLGDDFRAAGKLVGELALPKGVVLAAVMRQGEVIVPGGETRLAAGDEVLAVTEIDLEPALLAALH
ncbi:MAG: potassium channel family protein [Thermoleophilia bacterium]